MKIRKITSADLPLLAKANAKIFGYGASAQSLKAFKHSLLMGVQGASLIAEEEGAFVGAVFAEKKITFVPKSAVISAIFIAEGFRGKGVGTILLSRSLSVLRARGYKTVSLTVNDEKCPAFRMYSKLGFKKYKLLMLRRF